MMIIMMVIITSELVFKSCDTVISSWEYQDKFSNNFGGHWSEVISAVVAEVANFAGHINRVKRRKAKLRCFAGFTW